MEREVCGEVYGEVIKASDLESVNRHLLEKLDSLILQSSDPEEIVTLTEALSKFNASVRNNAIFTPSETTEERLQREKRATVADVLKGKG